MKHVRPVLPARRESAVPRSYGRDQCVHLVHRDSVQAQTSLEMRLWMNKRLNETLRTIPIPDLPRSQLQILEEGKGDLVILVDGSAIADAMPALRHELVHAWMHRFHAPIRPPARGSAAAPSPAARRARGRGARLTPGTGSKPPRVVERRWVGREVGGGGWPSSEAVRKISTI